MKNARDEIIQHIARVKKSITAIKVWTRNKGYYLHLGHTSIEFALFLQKLDFVYDNLIHEHEKALGGIIWYIDGSWCSRLAVKSIGQIWHHHEIPEMPLQCIKK